MTRTQTTVLSVCLCIFVGTAPAAFAEGSDDVDQLDAEEAYKRGAKLFDEGKYESAAKHFRRAVEQRPHPILYYNLSQTQVKLGNFEEARRLAQKAQEGEKLDEKTTAVNEATLAGIHVTSAARDIEPAPTPPRTDASDADPSTGTQGVGLSTFGWSGVGAMVGGAGMLVGSALVDRGLNDDFRKRRKARQSGDLNRARKLGDTIERKQTTGRILLYGGAGVAAVGTGLLAFDLLGVEPFARRSGVRFGLRIERGGGGLTIRYRSP